MKIRLKKILEYIFRNDKDFKNFPLHVIRKNVNVDAKLQRIFLDHYISTGCAKSKK